MKKIILAGVALATTLFCVISMQRKSTASSEPQVYEAKATWSR